jgi:hypothetical protein
MPEKQTLGEEQETPVGEEGADQGDEFATNTEEQLFGKEVTPSKGKASEGEPEVEPEIPLETIQAHPAFADVQGKYDRQGNVLKYQTEQIGQLNQQLKVFRDKQAAELIEQLGDTPETRNAVALIQRAQDMEGQAMAVMQQFGPLLKKERAIELLTQEGIPLGYLEDIVSADTFEEAVQKAKTIKSVLARLPKPAPGQKPGQKPSGTTKQRPPAMGHVPDKAQGSITPQGFEQAEEAYIAGNINFQQYKQAADKAGVKLQ